MPQRHPPPISSRRGRNVDMSSSTTPPTGPGCMSGCPMPAHVLSEVVATCALDWSHELIPSTNLCRKLALELDEWEGEKL